MRVGVCIAGVMRCGIDPVHGVRLCHQRLWPEDELVHHAEHCRIGTDAESKGQDDCSGKAGGTGHTTKSMVDVADEVVENPSHWRLSLECEVTHSDSLNAETVHLSCFRFTVWDVIDLVPNRE